MEYPTIYIRPAIQGGYTNPVMNFMSGYAVLEEIKAGAKLEIDKGVVDDLIDGTANVASEKISFESATLRVDTHTLKYLEGLKGSMVDIIMLDITVPSAIIRTAYCLRLVLGVLAQNDQSAIIRLSAEREFPSSALSVAYTENQMPAGYGIAAGMVTDKNDNPVPEASVIFDNKPGETAITNAKGQYLMFCAAGSKTVKTTKAGHTFPEQNATVVPYATIQHNIKATT